MRKVISRKPGEGSHPEPSQAPVKKPAPARTESTTEAAQAGDARWAAAQRQSLVTQAGQVVGNQGLARMIEARDPAPAPSLQRTIGWAGTLLLTSTLAAKEAVDGAIRDKGTLKAIQAEIDKLTPKTQEEDDEGKAGSGEERARRRTELVTGLRSLRSRIPVEVTAAELEVNEELANAIRRRFYLQLARIAPFYTQQENADILATRTTPAHMRTCNVTTVSMTLEGLGKTAAEFEGNSALMDNIVSLLDLGATDAAGLRFPDFMQVLAIYLEMVRGNSPAALNALARSDPEAFREIMVSAAVKAASNILSSDLFNRFTSKFGVSAHSHDLDFQKALAVFGGYYRPFDKDFNKYLKDKGKEKASGEKREALKEEFTEKRKARYRMRAAQAGKNLGESEASRKQTEAEIAGTRSKLAELEESMKALDADLASLDAQVSALESQIEATEDKTERKALKDKLAVARAGVKSKKKEQSAAERKKKGGEKTLREQESALRRTLAEIADFRLEQSASEAVGSETGEEAAVEEVLPLSVYKSAVIPLMQDLLAGGSQVIVVLHEHFVKLQDINEESIIVHDPGGRGRDNKAVSWETARNLGYFKRYNVVN